MSNTAPHVGAWSITAMWKVRFDNQAPQAMRNIDLISLVILSDKGLFFALVK